MAKATVKAKAAVKPHGVLAGYPGSAGRTKSFRKTRVRRVGVLSVAVIYAVLMGAFGVVLGLIYGVILGFMLSGGSVFAGIAISLLVMVILPAFYAAIGFVAGAISAAIYNLVAKFTGGVEIELE